MTSKSNGSIKRFNNPKHAESSSVNWATIAAGAVLSALTIRLYCKPELAFEAKRTTKTHTSLNEIPAVDDTLSLVKMPSALLSFANGRAIPASSLNRLDLPFDGLDLISESEVRSDIVHERETIRKLCRKIKLKDDMIIEMQEKTADLQNSLKIQMAQAACLQAQLNSSYQELFDSEREIQRIRRAISNHSVGANELPEKPLSAGKCVEICNVDINKT